MGRGRPWSGVVNLLFLFILLAAGWDWISNGRSPANSNGPTTKEESAREEDLSPIVKALTPGTAPAARDGIAAMVLIDVSGSMADRIRDEGKRRPKIDIAREAALTLVRQFDSYAKAHPEEPVLVGLMEFSDRNGSSVREVVPLSVADPIRAESALAKMEPDGGTPIGEAMIAGKRALDQTGLSRRHLLVVTDGENTDGAKPEAVMKALAHRPESERPSVYFVAFDVAASRFNAVRDAGSLVLPAANAQELDSTLGSLLSGKILVEGP